MDTIIRMIRSLMRVVSSAWRKMTRKEPPTTPRQLLATLVMVAEDRRLEWPGEARSQYPSCYEVHLSAADWAFYESLQDQAQERLTKGLAAHIALRDGEAPNLRVVLMRGRMRWGAPRIKTRFQDAHAHAQRQSSRFSMGGAAAAGIGREAANRYAASGFASEMEEWYSAPEQESEVVAAAEDDAPAADEPEDMSAADAPSDAAKTESVEDTSAPETDRAPAQAPHDTHPPDTADGAPYQAEIPQGNPDPLGINDTLLLDVDQADMEEALRATCRLHGDGGESAQSADCGVEYPAAQDPVSRAAVSGRSGDTLLQPYATSNPEALVKELFCAPSMDCPQLMGAPFSKGVPVTSHAIIGVPKSHATRPTIALPDVDAYRNVDPLHAVFERSKDGEWMVTCLSKRGVQVVRSCGSVETLHGGEATELQGGDTLVLPTGGHQADGLRFFTS